MGQSQADSISGYNESTGVYVAYSQHAFNRGGSLISKPLVSNNFNGFEIGIRMPLMYRKNIESTWSIGVTRYGVSEYFENQASERTETSIELLGIKTVLMPIVYKIEINSSILKIGLGGYAVYNFSKEFSLTPLIQTEFSGEQISSSEFGLNGQISLLISRFQIDFNMVNGISNVIPSMVEGDQIRLRGYNLGLTYYF